MSTVYLVGAGPGDPKLLTRRAYELITTAEVIVYDALVSPSILALIPEGTKLYHVGKRYGAHSLKQPEINDLLIELGTADLGRVVRLKGGDPFVFAHGGEEMTALREAGIPYEIVPGITAGLAAPAYFDIPLTHRGLSRSFTCLTAHTEDGELPDFDWTSLARLSGTLVFYMGVRQVAQISQALIAAGMPASTPAALLSRGTTPQQSLLERTLGAFTDASEDFSTYAPALFMIGEVLRFAEGRTSLPLSGKKVIVTRARHQASVLQEALEEKGAEAYLLSTIQLTPNEEVETELETTLESLPSYDWILFTSPNAVEFFFSALRQRGKDSRHLAPCQIGALGPMTAEALSAYGITADFVPREYYAKVFAEEFIQRAKLTPVKRILLPNSALASDDLSELLSEAGIACHRLPLYQNTPISYTDSELKEALDSADYLTACSSSAIHHLVSLLRVHQLEHLLKALPLAVLGEQTAEAARSYGIEPKLIATQPRITCLVEALVKDATN
ncbi:MAG: uroporphyrinogen-III C-methyltransferase [Porphyromonas sp.]